MSSQWILLTVLAISIVGFFVGRARALSSVNGNARLLHSRPNYYGWNVALFAAVPAVVVLAIWVLAQPIVVNRVISNNIPADEVSDAADRGNVMAQVRRSAGNLNAAVGADALSRTDAATLSPDDSDTLARLKSAGFDISNDPEVLAAAKDYSRFNRTAGQAMAGLTIALALAGFAFAFIRTRPDFRARNVVERVVKGILILCSSIAIATTVGIVLSLVFESIHFFQLYPWQDFLFGTQWTPSFGGGSKLGMLPLLWGTLYISVIALIVAVPVGLFAAIYMAEYASRRVRNAVKPAIEILAGIPTIVYGLFALMTVGPLLRDWIAAPTGLGNSSTSIMTAGLVMGIMLIPFVSSLSDDIITAVPQSLRDGSLGLGSTRSETIRNVVMPAALPGIVGAVLLAASRAIGETMIVVLGAGAMAKISGNPFEAMTTITVKIVGQLTGDNDFASPETLVAFALGLTLFVITLSLNVFALYIVRKYREQYE
ncbi:MAG: phosphate ABC transporter permease subunit PstC [Paracoccus denitrificans]|nr:MAG: phosphate ABC transporter permease subunit PstC [Paracoccus denitrificans]PZO86168.1 MAG: phosphate ABC transporter permease subunit PstC [Paracoccus denitrificans]